MHRRTFLRALGGAGVLALGGGVTAVVMRPARDGAPRVEVGAASPRPTPGTPHPSVPAPSPRPGVDPAGQGDRLAVQPEDEPTPEGTPEVVDTSDTATEDETDRDEAGAAAASAAVAVALHCRDAWDARPPTREYGGHTITRLTVHHTAVSGAGWDTGRIRRYQERHQEQGMADLAYHALVSPAGDAYEGRPFTAVGETFTAHDPTGHLNVVLEGNFDETQPSDAQLETLAALLAWGAGAFDVDPATISGHQRFASTACPGSSLQRVISTGELRAEVERLLATGGSDLRRTC